MKMRTMGENPTKSIRMTKEEWIDIKNKGDKLFNGRNIGYMQVAETDINFSTTSPYYKDFVELDAQDKERENEN